MTQTFMKEKKILPLVLSMSLPMVISMAVNSLYNIVDSYFVAKLSEEAMTALALVYPVQNLITSIAVGFGIGINACVAFYLGADDKLKADNAASSGVFLSIIHGILLMIFCIGGMPLFVRMFSSDEVVIGMALAYSRRAFAFAIMVTVGIAFEKIFQATGRMKVSMISIICGFVTNIVLDYLFIAVFRWGIGGAAVATGLGYSITAIVGLLVFSNRNSLLHFVRPVCRPQTLGRAVTNGCSEMATALVNGIITLMFNWTMLKYVGEDGVAAITIISYVLAFAGSLYAGYAYGVAPMLSFYYGEQNHEKLRKLVRTSLKIIGAIAAATVLVSLAVTEPLVSIFARPGTPVYDLAVAGNRICSLALLFVGFNIFASGMFTALSNGLISAVLAFSRTFVFTLIAMLVLPVILGVTGIWLATPAAELAAVVLSAVMLLKYRRRYCY